MVRRQGKAQARLTSQSRSIHLVSVFKETLYGWSYKRHGLRGEKEGRIGSGLRGIG